MTLDGNLLEALQKRRQRIQNLFGSGEPFSPIRKDFGGARLAAAFAHMRALKPGKVTLRNAQTAQHTSSSLANRMADFAAMVHLPASTAASSPSAYTGFAPVFPVPQAAAPAESPAQPGELRAGMSIARMGTVPRPGQSFDSFKAEAMASGLAKKPTAKAPTAPTPPKPQPGARVFSKVVEVKRAQSSVAPEEEEPSITEPTRPVEAPEPGEEVPPSKGVEPKLATRTPPAASPKANSPEPAASKASPKQVTAPAVVQRQVEPPAPTAPNTPVSEPKAPLLAEFAQPVEGNLPQPPRMPYAKPADLPVSPKVASEQPKPVAKPSPTQTKSALRSAVALPKIALAKPATAFAEAKPAQPKATVRPTQSTALPQTSPSQPSVQRQPEAGTAPRLTIPKKETAQPKENTPEEGRPMPVVAQANNEVPTTTQPTPAAQAAPEPSQPLPYLQEKLQRNLTLKSLASQKQPAQIPSRPALPMQQLPPMSLRKPGGHVPTQPAAQPQARTTPAASFGMPQAGRLAMQSLPATDSMPAIAQRPSFTAAQAIAPQMPAPLPMPNVIQRSPDAKPAPSTVAKTAPPLPANTAQTAAPVLTTSTEHIPSEGITRQNPGNVVQRLWEEHSEMGGQQSGGQATPQEASASASQDVEKLAKKILPLVKHYLEIELERVGGRFGR